LTRIKYITDGWLLRELARDPTASSYDVIMVDDAHERSLASDIVLALLRRLLTRQYSTGATTDAASVGVPRVIVSSATMNVAQIAAYFDHAPVLSIAGRMYPVRIVYLSRMPEDYVAAAVSQVMTVVSDWFQRVHAKKVASVEGVDVLVFLTGQEEIERAASLLRYQTQEVRVRASFARQHEKTNASSFRWSEIGLQDAPREMALTHMTARSPSSSTDEQQQQQLSSHNSQAEVVILPLYGALPSSEQLKICTQPPEPNTLRIILATNVAETSLTIPHVTTVIDSGYVKQRRYDRLEVVPISQASAKQRAGRAGRTAPGTCYRLYTETFYLEQMIPETIPEIQRVDLSQSLLLLKSMGIVRLSEISWLDAPDPAHVENSLSLLRHVGALVSQCQESEVGDPGRKQTDTAEVLTDPIGKRMAQMPLEPRMARALLAAEEYGCTEELLSAFAILSTGYQLFTRRGVAEAVPRFCRTAPDQVRDPLAYNDFLLLARIFDAWQAARNAPGWCQRNGVHYRVLRIALDIRRQLTAHVQQASASNPAQVVPALLTGFGDQTARLTRGGVYIREGTSPETRHSSSVVRKERVKRQLPLHVHPMSSLYRREWAPPRLLFYELIISKQAMMRCVCALTPIDKASRPTKATTADRRTARGGCRRRASSRWTFRNDLDHHPTGLPPVSGALSSEPRPVEKPLSSKRSRWDTV
jgi:HrpA-like RNA helicase